MTSTASSPARTAATTSTPLRTAALTVAATSSKSAPAGTTHTTGSPGCCSCSDPTGTVLPTPSLSPPGVAGLCPIIVDSVMIVSVIVSMASPLITGVASLSSTVSTSPTRRPARSTAPRMAASAPAVLSGVPLTPVVLVRSVARWTIEPSGPIEASEASVVELPMSTPTTSRAGDRPGSTVVTPAGVTRPARRRARPRPPDGRPRCTRTP